MLRSLLSIFALVPLALAGVVPRQGPNTGFQGHETDMTSAVNYTFHIAPVSKTLAQQLAGDLQLLPVTGLPDGFVSADQHILFFSQQYMSDIRQRLAGIDLRIEKLNSFSLVIPFVDAAKDGKTPFSLIRHVYNDQIVPTAVSALTGLDAEVASFKPKDAAYSQTAPGLFSFQILQGLANTIDGPGPEGPRFEALFEPAPQRSVTARQFQKIQELPITYTGRGCTNHYFDWGVPFAEPYFATADVETYSPLTPTAMKWTGLQSWSSSAIFGAPATVNLNAGLSDCGEIARNQTQQQGA